MTSRQLTVVALGFVAMCTVGLAAQTQETQTTTKTKVEVKGGKNVTVTGCVGRGSTGDYLLTQVGNDSHVERMRYALVTSEDLSKHVGERVEIKGQAVMNGHGKVSVETKSRTEVEDRKDQETKTKTESNGGAMDLPILGVRSMKTLSPSCR